MNPFLCAITITVLLANAPLPAGDDRRVAASNENLAPARSEPIEEADILFERAYELLRERNGSAALEQYAKALAKLKAIVGPESQLFTKRMERFFEFQQKAEPDIPRPTWAEQFATPEAAFERADELLRKHRGQEAIEQYGQALSSLKIAAGEDSPSYVQRKGRFVEFLEESLKAWPTPAQMEKIRAAHVVFGKAEKLQKDRQGGRAIEQYRKALAMLEEAVGVDSWRFIQRRQRLWQMLKDEKQITEAIEELKSLITLLIGSSTADESAILDSKLALSGLLESGGRLAEATSELRAALPGLEELDFKPSGFPRKEIPVMLLHIKLIELLIEQDKKTEAAQECREITGRLKKRFGEANDQSFGMQLMLAGTLSKHGLHADAEGQYRSMLAECLGHVEKKHVPFMINRSWAAVVQALRDQRKFDAALAEAEMLFA